MSTVIESPPELAFRAMAMGGAKGGPASLNVEDRTITAIIATENAVMMPDYDRMEMVPEVLLVEGARFPSQVPLLDNHQRTSAKDILGSVRMIRTEGKQLAARIEMSSISDDVLTRISEGHLTDLSVGYKVNKKRFIANGKSATVAGRSFTGPMNVVTSWTIREVSVTPIGADEQAKFRGFAPQKGTKMSSNLNSDVNEQPGNVQEALQTAQAERERINHFIREQLQAYPHEIDALISERCSWEEVGRRILDKKAANQVALRPAIGAFEFKERYYDSRGNLVPGLSQNEKFGATMRDAMLERSLRAAGDENFVRRNLPESKRAPGSSDYAHAPLIRIAQDFLESQGVDTRRMANHQIATECFNDHALHMVRSGGLHFSASFPNLLLDVSNKTLQAAYEEANVSYKIFRQGTSVQDFKQIHRVRLSEIANLNIWPDNTAPEQVALTDERETYGVEAYANIASFSWRLLVNDDLDALSRITAHFGNAAARTLNQVVWAQITSNPNLQDGQPLFSAATGNRKQTNLTTGAITVANLGTAKSIMRLQRGLNTKGGNQGSAILNITPSVLAVPAALETTAGQVIYSAHDPADNKNDVFNPFKGMTLAVEPLLDASSSQQWYVFATGPNSPIEYTFLAGQETPQTDSNVDFRTRAVELMIVQTFGAKAMDYRGGVRSTGS